MYTKLCPFQKVFFYRMHSLAFLTLTKDLEGLVTLELYNTYMFW